jgi:predicted transcriptional regulator
MLKAQDVLVLCKLVAGLEDQEWRQQDLADALGLSQAEVHKSLKRTAEALLYMPVHRKVIRRNFLEFVTHAISTCFQRC